MNIKRITLVLFSFILTSAYLSFTQRCLFCFPTRKKKKIVLGFCNKWRRVCTPLKMDMMSVRPKDCIEFSWLIFHSSTWLYFCFTITLLILKPRRLSRFDPIKIFLPGQLIVKGNFLCLYENDEQTFTFPVLLLTGCYVIATLSLIQFIWCHVCINLGFYSNSVLLLPELFVRICLLSMRGLTTILT